MITAQESWREVEGLGGRYFVSDAGRVKNAAGHIMAQAMNPRGYLHVHIAGGTASVHRLVASAFCNKPDGCDVVNHLNFEQVDNRATNLAWTTQQQNLAHARAAGRFPHTRKLSAETELEIFLIRRSASVPSARAMAAHYGVCRKTIIRTTRRVEMRIQNTRKAIAA